MVKLYEIAYGAAITVVLAAALCADSLAELPNGFRILFILIGVAAVLVEFGNRLKKKSRPQRWSSDGRQDQRKR